MREFTIVLPINGRPNNHEAHKQLRAKLLEIGGGYSAQFASGAWKSPEGDIIEEEHWRYSCAVDPAKVTDFHVANLATWLRDLSGESAIYVIHLDTEAVIY